ncbi:hypothetical protein, partial [Labrys sp. 22185]|uniref:hypothetical protein n=1 Tax=Labrys sp. 22185 TaxID=3453888 RepID=UPI003F86C7D4
AFRTRQIKRKQRSDFGPQRIGKELLGHDTKLTPTRLTNGFVRCSKTRRVRIRAFGALDKGFRPKEGYRGE